MSGQFTVGHPDILTGNSHLVSVKCDLCARDELFDPRKHVINNKIYEIIGAHVCIKPKKEPRKVFVIRFPRPKIMENLFRSRRQRLGPPEPEDNK